MFTGIIEALGTVDSLQLRGGEWRLSVHSAALDFSDVVLGDSIAVNGVCLTVTRMGHQVFDADVSNETLQLTTLHNLGKGSRVNLEKALTPVKRLGGHIVSGHVDGVGIDLVAMCVNDIITVGDKEFTKRQIRKANRNAKEALTKYIPAQQQQLIKVAQFGEMSKQYSEAAKKEVPEIQDEESEIGKNYKVLVEDPLVSRVKREIPEIGMQIEYILAHAARSIFGKKAKAIQAGAGNKLKVSPPASPVGSGSVKSGSNTKAKVKDAYSRFETTGSVDDWVASRIAKLK